MDKETILVVEDDRALAVGLDLNFSAEGYRVLVAGDGRRKETTLMVKEGAPNRLCWDFNAEATCSR